jgi:hypothetical protein
VEAAIAFSDPLQQDSNIDSFMPPFLLTTPPSNTVWIMIGIAGATILYAVFRPSLKKKDPLARSPSSASLAQQRNVERQMQNLLVELSEMARQLTAQLDTRSQKLEALLQEADEKIAQLRAAGVSANQPRPSAPNRQAWALPSEPAAPPDSQHQAVYTLADQGQSAPDIARQLNRPRGEVELILALRGTAER